MLFIVTMFTQAQSCTNGCSIVEFMPVAHVNQAGSVSRNNLPSSSTLPKLELRGDITDGLPGLTWLHVCSLTGGRSFLCQLLVNVTVW